MNCVAHLISRFAESRSRMVEDTKERFGQLEPVAQWTSRAPEREGERERERDWEREGESERELCEYREKTVKSDVKLTSHSWCPKYSACLWVSMWPRRSFFLVRRSYAVVLYRCGTCDGVAADSSPTKKRDLRRVLESRDVKRINGGLKQGQSKERDFQLMDVEYFPEDLFDLFFTVSIFTRLALEITRHRMNRVNKYSFKSQIDHT